MAGPTAVRELRATFTSDTKGFDAGAKKVQAGLKGVGEQADKASKQADSVGKSFGGLAKAFAAIGAAGVAFSAFRSAADDALAADRLAKAIENVGIAVDDAALDDYIKALSRSAAVADDDLRPALQTLVTATGDMAQAQGLLNIALDVSAGTGKDLQTVTLALAKASQGNVTSLGRMGIAVKNANGELKTFDEIMTELQQKYGGQAATFASSQAGQLQRLSIATEEAKEALGAGLAPAFNAVLGPITKFGEAMSGLSPDMVSFAASAGIAVTAAHFLGPAIGNVATSVTNLGTAVKSGGGFAALGKGLSGVVGVLGGPWGVAVAGGTLLLGHWLNKQAEARAETEAFTSALQYQEGAFVGNSEAAVANRLEKEGLLEDTKNYGIETKDLVKGILGEKDAQERVTESLRKSKKAIEDRIAAAKASGEPWMKLELERIELVKLEGVTDSLRGTTSDYAEAQERVADATGKTGSAAEGAAGGLGEFGEEEEEAEKTAEDLNAELGKMIDSLTILDPGFVSSAEAIAGWEEGLDKASEAAAKWAEDGITAVTKGQEAFDLTTEAGREAFDILKSQAEFGDVITQDMLARGVATAAVTAEDARQRDELFRVARQLGLNKDAAAAYVTELLKTPEQRLTELKVVADQQSAVLARQQIEAATALRPVALTVRPKLDPNWKTLLAQEMAGTRTKGGQTIGFAGGGFMPAGGPYAVGERGMELVFPGISSFVMANEQLRRAIGAGTKPQHINPQPQTVINVSVSGAMDPVATGRQITRTLDRYRTASGYGV